ncbi:MAG: prepilin-type N-terminal cleavage/methylation domain-containing protein [Erysipelotrichaceae bacterium]|nr:prepilin-type N-terminal cleavage/methylation domain-containing protein [Erysipelotrichaceae bacterium]
MKNLRNKLSERVNNNKGFTLVELIVVIVIILILSVVLVPNVYKYINKASQASATQSAATMLTQAQAELADDIATMVTDTTATEGPNGIITGKDSTGAYTFATSYEYGGNTTTTFTVDATTYEITTFAVTIDGHACSLANGKVTCQ